MVVLHGILTERMPYTDLTFNVTKQKLASMRGTLRELCDPAGTDDLWERQWWDKRRRLKQVLDYAEARAQQVEPRCLTDEYQLRRLWHLLFIIVHCPSHWEALALRLITWLPEASWIETARRHVAAIAREDFAFCR